VLPAAGRQLRSAVTSPLGAVLIVATALLGAGYVALAVVVNQGVPSGTVVRGVPVGGLTVAEARERLAAEVGDGGQEPMTGFGGRLDEVTIEPGKAGLSLDVPATVRAAERTVLHPWDLVLRAVSLRTMPVVVDVDDETLAAYVDDLAERTAQTERPALVWFEGDRVQTRDARWGIRLERDAAAEAIVDAYSAGRRRVELPVALTEPGVRDRQVERAVREFARPAVAAPLRLVVGGQRIPVAPTTLGASLSIEPDERGTLAPRLNAKRLHKALAQRIDRLDKAPRDARIVIRDGKPKVRKGRRGLSVTRAALREAVLPALREEAPRTARVRTTTRRPDLTTKEARRLKVREKVASFTTEHPYAKYRVTNIHRAADLMDGTLLRPGEVFSFNRVVGQRTPARGFAEGTVIENGRYRTAYGGGVSQLATTTFNAAFFAGLKLVEHHPHSWYISRYPVGREATVYFGQKDLRFRNDSGNGILVTTSYTRTSITVTLWGTKKYDDVRATRSERYGYTSFETIRDDGPRCVPQGGVRGFQIDVQRLFVQDGSVVERQRLNTDYDAEDRVICTGPG
jgi:vancomycin resistance protein YoaR